jgi:hypothetical protein
MAKDSLPPIHSLDKPEKLQDLLKEDRGDDCLPCKIVGEFEFSSSILLYDLQDQLPKTSC